MRIRHARVGQPRMSRLASRESVSPWHRQGQDQSTRSLDLRGPVQQTKTSTMNDAEKKVRAWFDELVPKIVRKFRKRDANARYELSVPNNSFYMSSMFYLTIDLPADPNNNEKAETLRLVVKRPVDDEQVRKSLMTDQQFHNECLFYRKLAMDSDEFPRYVYSEKEPTDDYVLVLKNAIEGGYEVLPRKYNAPIEYTMAAMRELGRFHGRGYAMKEKRSDEFFETIRDIQETRFDTRNEHFKTVVNVAAPRTVEYMRANGYDGGFCDQMETLLRNCFDEIMMKAVVPVEPLATLCHGDYTLNNMLFKQENGRINAMLIDFALLRYGSPALDLSTYFALCCSNDAMRHRFPEIFRVYHESLTNYLLEAGVTDLDKYSYEAFILDYKQRALFGFVIASFYLAVLMEYPIPSTREIFQSDIREFAFTITQLGGDEVNKVLADMLLILKDMGCLDHRL